MMKSKKIFETVYTYNEDGNVLTHTTTIWEDVPDYNSGTYTYGGAGTQFPIKWYNSGISNFNGPV